MSFSYLQQAPSLLLFGVLRLALSYVLCWYFRKQRAILPVCLSSLIEPSARYGVKSILDERNFSLMDSGGGGIRKTTDLFIQL